MEEIRYSETCVTTYKTTWYYNPEDHNPALSLYIANCAIVIDWLFDNVISAAEIM
jgi:dTDP-4-dehydrorhamnose 3,5-epimerase-like enzyme